MPKPLRAESDELTADEILDALRGDRHVVVQVELPGGVHEMTLRHDGTVFYYNTSTTLHKHEDEDGIRACVLGMGYTKE